MSDLHGSDEDSSSSFFDPSWTKTYVDIRAMCAIPKIISYQSDDEIEFQASSATSSEVKTVKERKSRKHRIKLPKPRNRVSNIVSSEIIENMTSSSILAATTKKFEDLKRARLNAVGDVPASIANEGDLQDFQRKATAFQEKRVQPESSVQSTLIPESLPKSKQINQVWGKIISQQLVSEVSVGVVGLDVQNGYGVGNRGPENYITRLMRKRKIETEDGTVQNINVEEESDLSSDGLSDDSKNYWYAKKNKNRKRGVEACSSILSQNGEDSKTSVTLINASSSAVDTSLTKESSQCESFYELQGKSNDETGKQNILPKATSEEKPKKRVSYLRQKLQDMNPEQLGHYLATRLKEKNRDLIVRAVELLGKDKCINLFFKVLKIEGGGGLLIKSKTRRRTRGGVFLYLIRNDKRIPVEKVDLLFKEDNTRRMEYLKTVSEEQQRRMLIAQGMDELQLRIHQRMATESVGMEEMRKLEESNVCDLDKDEEFSFSVDKLVHHKPGYVPHEGPVGNREAVVYDDIEMIEQEVITIAD